MIESGCADSLGATPSADGTNFAVFSSSADRVELCLFDENDIETRRIDINEKTVDGIWHGFVPGCRPGQKYGYRVHGRHDPDLGLRHNPAQLLIDPYARALSGTFSYSPAVFDFEFVNDKMRLNELDSAQWIPKSVVVDSTPEVKSNLIRIPWSQTIIYEANVRGYTMQHPDIPTDERGRFGGMRNGEILSYLKALGVTSIELMPVFEFIDEPFLIDRDLRNFWGYNTINFFTPAGRYADRNPVVEFLDMVNSLHDSGFEVILDVAYNHTGEADDRGPTLCYRGLDNLSYYRTNPENPGEYTNHTGTGNTINTDHEQVRRLIVDSLRYWSTELGVDGFRFDLATVLGRTVTGFAQDHELLAQISSDPQLSRLKLIAEPWDPGVGGYQLGKFPENWAEWNDRYRDSVRRFWRGDAGETSEFAARIHGSADIFENSNRGPWSSVNFVTAHDGFTLSDLVSYEVRHNYENGEENRDGHRHNFSSNYGVEGATEDADINAQRRNHRLNMLATLLLSQGTPMLLAGDELGNSQRGNNNAYAQDNETGWIDWSHLKTEPEFLRAVRALIQIRRENPVYHAAAYPHGNILGDTGVRDIEWLDPHGKPMLPENWSHARSFTLVLNSGDPRSSSEISTTALLINSSSESIPFTLPARKVEHEWRVRFTSAGGVVKPLSFRQWFIPGRSLACMMSP